VDGSGDAGGLVRVLDLGLASIAQPLDFFELSISSQPELRFTTGAGLLPLADIGVAPVNFLLFGKLNEDDNALISLKNE
jgi:hypothetical protein